MCTALRIVFFTTLPALLFASGVPDLAWDDRHLRLEVPFDSKRISGHFHFINNGRVPLEIANLETSCACTKASHPGGAVPPGKRGTIRIDFDVGDRTGSHRFMVTVQYGCGGQERLQVFAEIESPFEIHPRLLRWTREEYHTQAFRIRLNPRLVPFAGRITVSAPGYDAAIIWDDIPKEEESPGAFAQGQLQLTPKSGAGPRELIRISVFGDAESEKPLRIYSAMAMRR